MTLDTLGKSLDYLEVERSPDLTLVSVIVPVYNTEAYLCECLDSILAQDISNIEIIVINDASPDKSRIIIEEYTRRDSRVNFIDLEKNVGLGFARNEGIRRAKGHWIAMLDSDDIMAPGSLQQLISLGAKYGSQIVIGGVSVREDKRDGSSQVVKQSAYPHLSGLVGLTNLSEYPDLIDVPSCWSAIYQREFLINGQIEFQRKFQEDNDFVVHALLEAEKVTIAGKVPYVVYRKRAPHAGPSITQSAWQGERYDMLLSHFERLIALFNTAIYAERHPELLSFRKWRLSHMFGTFVEAVLPAVLPRRHSQEVILGLERLAQCVEATELKEMGLELDVSSLRRRPHLAADGYYNLILLLILAREWDVLADVSANGKIHPDDAARILITDRASEEDLAQQFESYFSRRRSIVAQVSETRSRKIPPQIEEVTLHIGTTKTGTTAIQNFLEANNKELIKNGFIFPLSGMHYDSRGGMKRSSGHQTLLRDARDGSDNFVNELATELALRPKVSKLVLSAENMFHALPHTSLPRLKDFFDDRPVRIIAYLRRQDQWLESMYAEAISGGYLKVDCSFQEFLRREMAHGSLDYYRTLKAWAAVFGHENLTVVPYSSSGVLVDFCKTVGLGFLDQYHEPDEKGANRSNLDHHALGLLRLANALPFESNQIGYRDFVDEFFALHASHSAQKVGWFKGRERKTLLKSLDRSNRKVADNFRFGGDLFGSVKDYQLTDDETRDVDFVFGHEELGGLLNLYVKHRATGAEPVAKSNNARQNNIANKSDKGVTERVPFRVRLVGILSPNISAKKLNKLARDPRRYFADSKHTPIRLLRHLY